MRKKCKLQIFCEWQIILCLENSVRFKVYSKDTADENESLGKQIYWKQGYESAAEWGTANEGVF